MQMPVCSFSIAFITTEMFCCTSEFSNFSLACILSSTYINHFAQIYDGTKTNINEENDRDTKQNNAVGNEGSPCK